MRIASRCICTVVSERGLGAILDDPLDPRHKSGAGLRDAHPWKVARELLDAARADGERLAAIFAVGSPSTLSHWALINTIEVREMHYMSVREDPTRAPGQWETRCEFGALTAVNPIWQQLDSLCLAPSNELLHREAVEPVRLHREPLTEALIHPYAICETPAFIPQHFHDAGKP